MDEKRNANPFPGSPDEEKKLAALLHPFDSYTLTGNERFAIIGAVKQAANMLIDGGVWSQPLTETEKQSVSDALAEIASHPQLSFMLAQQRVIPGGDSPQYLAQEVCMTILLIAMLENPRHRFFENFLDKE